MVRFADGRYQLLRSLGRGGMGEVHLAVARGAVGFEKLVAIKLLDERLVRDADLTRSLLREAFLGVHLDHQNIVSILDLGENEGRFFVVMEYVRGYTLAHVLSFLGQGRPMPLAGAMYVTRATLDAVAYVHELKGSDGRRLGLVHGDVSPSNVLLGADGRVKLTDFGLATLDTDVEGSTIAGKLPYMPPEAFSGAKRTQAWDTYAAAALLYETLCAEPAFPGTTLEQVRTNLRRGVPPLAERRPDVPPALAEVIERSLSFHPERRIATIAELRAALDVAVPRHVDDADVHRVLVGSVYADPGFVQRHGELPSGVAFNAEQERAVLLHDSTQIAPKTQGRVRPRPLRFGISPAQGAAKARELATRFTGLLTERMQREVRPVVLADYSMLVECLVHGEIDLAWTPPMSFAAAAERGAGLLAKMVRAGQTTYVSALITRADSDIHTLEDLRGREIAWVDRDSASGYLFVAAELRRVLGDLDGVLGEQHFLGSHRAVCENVANGWTQAGATYASRDASGATVSSGWNDVLGSRAPAIRALWFSGPIPADGIAHRPFLPPDIVAELSQALVDLGASPEGRKMLGAIFNAESLVAADLRDYDAIRESLREV